MPLHFTLNGRTTALRAAESLFEAADRLGIAVPSSCRKQGKCRECLVEITGGMDALTPRSSEEEHLKDGFRLSCRTRGLSADEGGYVRAHTLRRAAMQVESGAVNLPAAGRAGPLDPAVIRDGDRILLDGVEIDRRSGPLHGLALDIGTTTIVIRCIDLETGVAVAVTSFENPQRFGGTDVMARIQFDSDQPGRLLQRTLLGYIGRAIAEFPVDPQSIYECVVAGNTTMRDLFFGLDVRSIGQKPYWSITEHAFRAGERATTAIAVTVKQLHLPIHPDARVYGLPVVGGHVGADAAACLLAIGPHRSDEFLAIMDIGTNTELFMGNRDRLLCASCPAGPAFEGGAITCGMPGLEGAVSRLTLDNDGHARCEVIGGGEPEGICGSGLVDLLSELLRTGRMNDYGRFIDGEDTFVIDKAHSIVLRESDVNELAQAKGANVAGLLVVEKRYRRPIEELDRFYLAGGFGRHIDIAAARRIGLIPDLPDEKIIPIGNAAIEGASIALLSVSARREIEQLVTQIGHVELETDPDFFDDFVTGCRFMPIGNPEPQLEPQSNV